MNIRKWALAAGLLAFPTLANAAGNYQNYPQVGEPSFCASTVTGAGAPFGGATGQGQGTTGSICAQTVPAGPPQLTGTEIMPADTATGNSSPPQSVTIPLTLLPTGSLDYIPLIGTGQTFTLPNNINTVVFDASATVATLTLTMPSSPLLGQSVRVASTHTITALSVLAPSGATVTQAPTALTVSTTAGYGYDFVWAAAPSGWIRLQ